MILIKHKDKDIRFSATILTGKIDFCSAHAKDIETKKHYLLIDKIGKED